MFEYLIRHKSCVTKDGKIFLEPKLGSVYFENFNDAEEVTLFLQKESGNGQAVIKTNSETKELTVYSKSIATEVKISSCDWIEVSRPINSIGQISVIDLKVKISDTMKNWKNLIAKCGNYGGIRLVSGKLLVGPNAWIDSSNIESIQTNPPNIFSNNSEKIRFNSSGEIIDLKVISNQILNSKIATSISSPFPIITPYNTNAQLNIQMNEIPTVNNYVFDSDKLNSFAKTSIISNNKLVKSISSTGQNYLVIKKFGNYIQPISQLKPNFEYLFSLIGKRINGNGKVFVSLSGGAEETINFDSNILTKTIKIISGSSVGELKIRMTNESLGEVLISKILIEEFGPNNSYKIQPENSNIELKQSFNITSNAIAAPAVSNEKKFVIIIPSYNNARWCVKNINSALNQNYENYRIIFIDDNSNDQTFEKVSEIVSSSPKASKVSLIRNQNRLGALENIYNAVLTCADDEIILTLDGDDWLAHNGVLTKLQTIYAPEHVWITYGQYKSFPGGIVGVSKPYPQKIIDANAFRQHGWGASHLRTFYAWLFKKIKKQDLLYEGKFLQMTWDFAMMFPMLEMAGNHSYFISDVLYIYNLENPLNDHKVNLALQQKLSHYILTSPKYEQLSFITFHELGKFGRLGNQMFQIAAMLSAAVKNGSVMSANWYCGYTKKDMRQFFKNAYSLCSDSIKPNFTYNEPVFSYSELPKNKSMNLHGYFQSEKYFKDIEDLIRFYFEPTDSVVVKLKSKYGNIFENSCAVHVRRGDFVGNKTHQVCDQDYYNRAIELMKSKTQVDNFLIFSDDIVWCKANFPSDYHFIDGNLDVEDLFLLSFCTNQIISNSSFSWWGAWLNKNPNKIIIAPKRWFADGKLDDKDIYTKDMIKI